MNDMTIGMENLPNIYIKSIKIERRSDDFLTISVLLSMFDHVETPTWRGRLNDLKAKVLFTNGEIASKLDNGEASLYDFAPQAGVLVESCNDFRENTITPQVSEYNKLIRFDTPFFTDLNVYVACFVDDLGFGIPMFDKFYGPMVGEKIITAGRRNEISGYFYYPDTNEEYAGPVHRQGNMYMEGSEHSDKEHKALRFVEEENFKISGQARASTGQRGR